MRKPPSPTLCESLVSLHGLQTKGSGLTVVYLVALSFPPGRHLPSLFPSSDLQGGTLNCVCLKISAHHKLHVFEEERGCRRRLSSRATHTLYPNVPISIGVIGRTFE